MKLSKMRYEYLSIARGLLCPLQFRLINYSQSTLVIARVGVVCAIRESASNPTGKKVGMAAERDSGNE